MANQTKPKLVLVQTRLLPKDAKRLEAARKRAGVLSMAGFVRQILLESLPDDD